MKTSKKRLTKNISFPLFTRQILTIPQNDEAVRYWGDNDDFYY